MNWLKFNINTTDISDLVNKLTMIQKLMKLNRKLLIMNIVIRI